MEITDERQVQNTREKLRLLEDRYDAVKRDVADTTRARDWTLRSLKRLINQFKEEIARFESRARARPTK
jgi:hypothetical protein